MDGIASFLAGTSDASHSSPRRLSQDPGEWAGEITQLVYGMIPPEVPARAQVHFNQQDEINGYAVGSIHLSDNDGNVKGFIPVIVRRFMLKPLDTIVSDSKFAPFTENRLRELFGSVAMDEGTIDLWKVRDGADQSLDETNPSSAGLYPYAGAPMSREDFLQTLSAEDQADLKAALSSSAETMGVMNAMGKQAAVKELMTVPAPPEPEAPVVSVRSFEKIAAGKYRIMTSYEGNFGPTVVETGENGLRLAIKEAVPEQKDEWLTRVHTDGSATLKSLADDSEKNLAEAENINQGPRGSEVFLYRTDRAEPEDGTTQGGCYAMTTSGQRIRGILLPKVVKLDGTSVNTKLFVGRHVAGIQPKFAVERLSGVVDMQEEVEDAVPGRGDTGTLVHIDESGDAVALVPMTVESVYGNSGDMKSCHYGGEDEPPGPTLTITGRTMLGERVDLVLSSVKGVVDITPDWMMKEGPKQRRRRYAVSSEFKWVPMAEFKEFMSSPRVMRDAEDLEKKAATTELRVIDIGFGFGFQAPWIPDAQAAIDKTAATLGQMLAPGMGANAAAAGAALSPKPPVAPPAAAAQEGVKKVSSIDYSCLSEGEARHVLCELGANLATADGILKAAKERGSLRVRGLDDPTEKLAASPFLSVPSKTNMLRAALMGLGIGGLGVAAGGGASLGAAAHEMTPEAMGQADRGNIEAQNVFNEIQRRRQGGRGPASNRRLGGMLETMESVQESRPFGDFFGNPITDTTYIHGEDMRPDPRFMKTQSASPALEAVAALRHLAKTAFDPLAYAAGVTYRRSIDSDGAIKLAEAGDTIDAALDLNFLNSQNLSYFIGLQPKMKDVLDSLCRLLVAVRMGLPGVDEETVRSAVKQVDSILTGLRALSFAETDA